MADGGGEKQLTYTQDNVSVRMLSSRGEETISGKLEITKEKHGHVVTWLAYPPPSAAKEQPQRYDEDSAGVWEDLTADSPVAYHVGGKDNCQSPDSVKIKKENGTSAGDSPSPVPHTTVSFEVTDLTSYRCRQVADTHELTLNLSDGTRLPTFIFIERRYEHFIRALHEHISFKRSDPADPYSLVHATPRQDMSPATEQAVEDAASHSASQPANNSASHSSSTADSSTPAARPILANPPHAIQLFVSRAPNVIVQSQPDGQTRLVPQQAMRLLLSQGSHPPINGQQSQVPPHPVRFVVQQTPPPPPSPQPPPAVPSFPSGLVITDVRSQAPGQSGSPRPRPIHAIRRRGPHWPTEEKMELLSLLKKRRMLINPRLAEGMSKKDKLDGWKEVTDILNSHHPGGRCVAEVKKQWQNLFLKAKRERRELLSDGSKNDAELTSEQFTGLSLKVFETFGQRYHWRDDDTPMDADAGDSILGPSSCLEQDALYLSESHHPEVILLPRSPDPSEPAGQLTDDSDHKFGATMSNGDSSQLCDQSLSGEPPSASECLTNVNRAPMQFKREPEDPPEPKQECWPENTASGSEDDRATMWDARHMRTDYTGGQTNNGITFLGSIAKMCDTVQKAASEVVSLKRREHKMKMSVLRAKMEYYETKRRKLQQSEGGGGAA
ncbi:uncharacterized protein [Dermacentor albipictus]|uniref:uncharacterized protein isoform X3 n=1 Tax=Dermacentor albipictus TaxID=60249 RepID=UPI0031FD7C56